VISMLWWGSSLICGCKGTTIFCNSQIFLYLFSFLASFPPKSLAV